MKQLKFEPDYMVYVQGGQRPQATHLTIGDAKTEAERLCRKENKPAFVYTATHCVQPVPSVLEWINGRKTI